MKFKFLSNFKYIIFTYRINILIDFYILILHSRLMSNSIIIIVAFSLFALSRSAMDINKTMINIISPDSLRNKYTDSNFCNDFPT